MITAQKDVTHIQRVKMQIKFGTELEAMRTIGQKAKLALRNSDLQDMIVNKKVQHYTKASHFTPVLIYILYVYNLLDQL